MDFLVGGFGLWLLFYRISFLFLFAKFLRAVLDGSQTSHYRGNCAYRKEDGHDTRCAFKRTFCMLAFLLILSDISNIYQSLLLIDDIIKMSKNTKTKNQRRVPVRICFGKLFSTSFLCHCVEIFAEFTVSLSYDITEQNSEVFKQFRSR